MPTVTQDFIEQTAERLAELESEITSLVDENAELRQNYEDAMAQLMQLQRDRMMAA